jgi:hypothetical protein
MGPNWHEEWDERFAQAALQRLGGGCAEAKAAV